MESLKVDMNMDIHTKVHVHMRWWYGPEWGKTDDDDKGKRTFLGHNAKCPRPSYKEKVDSDLAT